MSESVGSPPRLLVTCFFQDCMLGTVLLGTFKTFKTTLNYFQGPVQDPDNELHQEGGVSVSINFKMTLLAWWLAAYPSYYAQVLHGRL